MAPHPKCEQHGKTMYPTQKSAERAMRRIRRENPLAVQQVPQRVYGPDVCGAYHLTSQPERIRAND